MDVDKFIQVLDQWRTELLHSKSLGAEKFQVNIPQEVFNLTNLIRKSHVDAIPRSTLEQMHVAGATLLLNRESLLSSLPKGGLVAELGVDTGDFSRQILRITSPSKLYLVDVWNTERYNDVKALSVSSRFSSEIEAGRVEICRSLSTEAVSTFENGSLDWVYIDTDHSYKTTLAELYAYAPKIKPKGYMAGHDYVMGNWGGSYKYGVIEAVAEFCVKEDWRITHITADFSENNSFAISRME